MPNPELEMLFASKATKLICGNTKLPELSDTLFIDAEHRVVETRGLYSKDKRSYDENNFETHLWRMSDVFSNFELSCTIDSDGNVLQISKEINSTNWTYDKLELSPDTFAITKYYFSNQNRLVKSESNGFEISYLYDDEGMLIERTSRGGVEVRYKYFYDKKQLTRIEITKAGKKEYSKFFIEAQDIDSSCNHHQCISCVFVKGQ